MCENMPVMRNRHVLVVEDDDDVLELLRYNLSKEGYVLTCVTSGEEALEKMGPPCPDIVILDLMLPGIDGLEVCRTIRQRTDTRNVPVVMLTAKGEEADIVTGLELGADDYITKPFSPRVLIARIRAVLRRKESPTPGEDTAVTMPDLSIDPDKHKVLVKGKPVDLSITEFKILHLLARYPGKVFTRDNIIDSVHGEAYPVTDRSVDVQIVGLRKKLRRLGKQIETVRGVGYRFKE